MATAFKFLFGTHHSLVYALVDLRRASCACMAHWRAYGIHIADADNYDNMNNVTEPNGAGQRTYVRDPSQLATAAVPVYALAVAGSRYSASLAEVRHASMYMYSIVAMPDTGLRSVCPGTWNRPPGLTVLDPDGPGLCWTLSYRIVGLRRDSASSVRCCNSSGRQKRLGVLEEMAGH